MIQYVGNVKGPSDERSTKYVVKWDSGLLGYKDQVCCQGRMVLFVLSVYVVSIILSE